MSSTGHRQRGGAGGAAGGACRRALGVVTGRDVREKSFALAAALLPGLPAAIVMTVAGLPDMTIVVQVPGRVSGSLRS